MKKYLGYMKSGLHRYAWEPSSFAPREIFPKLFHGGSSAGSPPMDVEEGRKDLPQGGGYIRYVPTTLELEQVGAVPRVRISVAKKHQQHTSLVR